MGGTAVQGLLSHPTDKIELITGEHMYAALPDRGVRRMTLQEYRGHILPPLIAAVQAGKLGQFSVAPLFRAVLLPDGSS